MKVYSAKKLDDVINLACQDLGVTPSELHYNVTEEVNTLFHKKVEIEVWTVEMVQRYIEAYLRKVLTGMEFEVETVSYYQDGRIYVNMNTSNNSILIGKGGVILRAINLLVRNSVTNKFKERIDISVDINGYREHRYRKVAAMAKRFGKSVQKTKTTVKLDPLPGDERKVIHQVIQEMDHLGTESKGKGQGRYVTIFYQE